MTTTTDTPEVIRTVSAATVLEAEGARIGIVACERCGAAILLDPRDKTDRPKLHAAWHDAHDHAEGADQ